MRTLDLGCGKNKRAGAIGLDQDRNVNPDVVHEVRFRRKLPFEDNYFDEIYMIDFIEHVDNIEWLFSEVHRVSLPDSYVEIQYPHYSSPNFHNDITHHHGLGMHALFHYDPTSALGKKYGSYTHLERDFPFKIEKVDAIFNQDLIGKISNILSGIVGFNSYEAYISGILPIMNVHVDLRVLK